MKQEIWLLGLSYKTAPVEIRERFALEGPLADATGCVSPDEEIQECMILSTCNRVEILAVSSKDDPSPFLLRRWAAAREESMDALAPHVYIHKGHMAVRHIFSVASSLDSMVLGEPQILGQLKEAYRKALERNTVKVILNRLLHKSFSVAKRVRSSTNIAANAVSVSYAAVELAKRIFGDMSGVSALLIGAGEMAELAAVHLVNAGLRSLYVTNRTAGRASRLASACSAEIVPFEDLSGSLARVDIVISSTGAQRPLITVEDMRPLLRKRRNRPMFFIDIAVPRDIDPRVNTLDNIYLYDIDDLREVVAENQAQRLQEATRARTLVDEETAVFCRWLASLDLQPTIVDIIRRSERIAQKETERTLKRLPSLPEEQREAIAAMAAAIVKKINHEPITFLKRQGGDQDAGIQAVSLARRLFNLDRGEAPDDSCSGGEGK
ncbi:MAG: glutamyl-tRNA reductase [Desulfovibrio sp.]|jgi:glutamyl-tRNA reductase|nr:glutamyl-tRNA reductase [Desulfovibrio sp.]